MKKIRYFSTFSGIGGFELGIQQAYEIISKSNSNQREIYTKQANGGHMSDNRGNDMEKPLCVGYSEIDKYAIQIYEKHFPQHKNYGDITKIKEEELPDFDFLCGGFPCQSFSIAGKRGGFNDTRGTLFFDIARILRSKQPRLLLLENVKGLLSHDEGRTFAVIIGMTSNGKCLTARISESPRIGNECSLSDILEEHVDQKYFLSEKVIKSLKLHAIRRGKSWPMRSGQNSADPI